MAPSDDFKVPAEFMKLALQYGLDGEGDAAVCFVEFEPDMEEMRNMDVRTMSADSFSRAYAGVKSDCKFLKDAMGAFNGFRGQLAQAKQAFINRLAEIDREEGTKTDGKEICKYTLTETGRATVSHTFHTEDACEAATDARGDLEDKAEDIGEKMQVIKDGIVAPVKAGFQKLSVYDVSAFGGYVKARSEFVKKWNSTPEEFEGIVDKLIEKEDERKSFVERRKVVLAFIDMYNETAEKCKKVAQGLDLEAVRGLLGRAGEAVKEEHKAKPLPNLMLNYYIMKKAVELAKAQ